MLVQFHPIFVKVSLLLCSSFNPPSVNTLFNKYDISGIMTKMWYRPESMVQLPLTEGLSVAYSSQSFGSSR